MLEIKGKVNTAICYASVIEQDAIEQIQRMCDYEFTAGSKVRIMPRFTVYMPHPISTPTTFGTALSITVMVVPIVQPLPA